MLLFFGRDLCSARNDAIDNGGRLALTTTRPRFGLERANSLRAQSSSGANEAALHRLRKLADNAQHSH